MSESNNQGKIYFFISTISNGGAEAVCVNVANGLAERGWQVDILVLHTKEKSYIDRLSSKVNLVDLKANRARYAAPALLWYLLRNRPKNLVIFKYELIDLVVMLKKVFRFKTKLIGRNISIFSEVKSLKPASKHKIIKDKLLGKPIEHLDCIINQSYEMQKDLLAVFPNMKSKSMVIHNPVAAAIERFSQENPQTEKKEPSYILCVGRLANVKAFHHAINAFVLLANQYPTLRLKFVGQGELESSLKALAKEHSLQDRIDFEGFQTNVISYYRNASLTLLTSNYEGFPNVLIESIVLGTPVVSFDCPSGPREILDYGKYGKLVEPGNIKGLANAMQNVLENPHQFNLEQRAEFFSVEKAINKYIDILEKVN